MSARVLVTDHVARDFELERSLFEAEGVEVVVAPDTEEQTLATLASEADALLVCYAPVSRRVVEAASAGGVRVIARSGIGWDNIDVEAAREADIPVTYVPDYCIGEVADHTFALLLALARGVIAAADSVCGGEWRIPRGTVHRLAGRRLALVGVGRIGMAVARRAAAFDLDVVAFDPFKTDWASGQLERAETLEEALAEADFVSLHAPLTPDTHHIIDAASIATMRRRPALVNTSRGPLVDLAAVTRALERGELSGVALDVTDPEPLPAGHRLRSHVHAIVTPHMAFYSVEAEEELRRRACDEVLRALAGRPPLSPIPPGPSSGGGDDG
ncbi:MAG: D-3-phosphoglycerate dehydrogenase / 2-oxoglutarate reductase [Thermoleophilaceae bacterium]|jgi:D-3-phosphoglycerate dehydrogenase|nr:D-3-phosphoglycerate dehydrogenase / 2-oxoglutarate reductase [Thermoleophilaceae bacterium]